jgi:hypothetical protein
MGLETQGRWLSQLCRQRVGWRVTVGAQNVHVAALHCLSVLQELHKSKNSLLLQVRQQLRKLIHARLQSLSFARRHTTNHPAAESKHTLHTTDAQHRQWFVRNTAARAEGPTPVAALNHASSSQLSSHTTERAPQARGANTRRSRRSRAPSTIFSAVQHGAPRRPPTDATAGDTCRRLSTAS